MKIGRNDPCPCGSGEKYKKCCLNKLENKLTEYRRLLGMEQNIKNKLTKWATQNLELDEYSQYFNGKLFQEIVEEERETEDMKEEGEEKESGSELVGFFDWLFLEAIHHQENKRVIEVIREDFSGLFNSKELEIIDEWLNHTQAGIYEVETTAPAELTFKVREIFTNKEYEILDVKGSSHAVRGDVFFGRLQTIFSKHYLSGVLSGISRHWLDEFKEFITEKYQEAKKADPQLSYERFMNTHSKIVQDYSPPPLKIISPAGDEVKVCEATYSLSEIENEEVVGWLAKNKQFVLTEEEYGREGDVTTAYFIHLQSEKEISSIGGGIVTSQEWNDEEGNRFKTDGSIELKKNKWVVFSTSKKIFDQLNRELKQKFGASFHLEREQITPLEKIMNERGDKKDRLPKQSKEILKLEQEYLTKYYQEWCDMKIPALNNQTPRQAIKAKAGREAVKKMILDLENQELHDIKEGVKTVPIVKVIREELDFYD